MLCSCSCKPVSIEQALFDVARAALENVMEKAAELGLC